MTLLSNYDDSRPFDFYKLAKTAPTKKLKKYSSDQTNIFYMIFDIGYQFMDASVGTSSPNSSVCIGNATVLKDSAEIVLAQFNLQLYDKMGVTLKRMLVAVNPIASACYYSGFEFYQIVVDYFMTIIDY